MHPFFSVAIVHTIVISIPLTFHTIGIWLLLKPNSFPTNQKIYLIQLSTSEILFLLAQNIILFMKVYHLDTTPYYEYMLLFLLCAVSLTWLYIMVAMTIDRHLQISLNIKYELYVTTKRTCCVSIICWFIASISFLGLSLLKYFNNTQSRVIVVSYVLPVHHVIIIIIFISTYSYIYYRIKKCRRRERLTVSLTTQTRRTFLIPFLIVSILIVFVVLPEILHLFVVHGKVEKVQESVLLLVSMFLFDLGSLVDALVYIMINKSIRLKFTRMVRKRRVNKVTDGICVAGKTSFRVRTI